MTIKQKVDKYLKDNYGDVVFETKIKGFRWQKIADKIGKDINKDFVKDRWKVVKKKMEETNNTKSGYDPIITQELEKERISNLNKTLPQNHTISFEVTNPIVKELYTPKKQPWSFITFLKNLFKNL
jgi:hypothetical protein